MQHNQTIIYTGNFSIEEMNAAGKRVFANALIMKELGYHMVMVGVSPSDIENTDICETRSEKEGIEIYHYTSELFNHHRSNYILFYRQFEKLLSTKKWDVKIIVGYNSPSTAPFIGKVQNYCRKNGIRHVMDVADWLIVDSDNLLFKILRQFDITLKNVYYSNRSNGIIAISSWLEQYYKRRGKRTIIIPPLALKKNISNKDRADITQIVYAGIPFRKGALMKNPSAMKDRFDVVCALLLQAKQEDCNFEFHVYGFAKEEILFSVPSLTNIIKELDESISFHGLTSMEEVQQAVCDADYTILIREKNRMTMAGFPTKISESISCGTPVITTDTSDINQYLKENEGAFYIDILDMKESFEKMTELMNKTVEERIKQKQTCECISSFDRNTYKDAMQNFLKKVFQLN